MNELLKIMQALRHPETGCPWDIEQTFETIAPYTIEEAYEVEDAIRSGDMEELKKELGDLLLQVVFHSQMASEKGYFDFADVVAAISEKMLKRHPHVFAGATIEDAKAQEQAWEEQKTKEREQKARESGSRISVLDGVALGLPALMRAVKLQKRAAHIGFDWPYASDVFDKVQEECAELIEAMESGDRDHIEEEYGDLLFVISNLSRHINVDAEKSLRRANEKFERRFKAVEEHLRKRGIKAGASSLEELDAFWCQVKEEEKAATS